MHHEQFVLQRQFENFGKPKSFVTSLISWQLQVVWQCVCNCQLINDQETWRTTLTSSRPWRSQRRTWKKQVASFDRKGQYGVSPEFYQYSSCVRNFLNRYFRQFSQPVIFRPEAKLINHVNLSLDFPPCHDINIYSQTTLQHLWSLPSFGMWPM